MIPACITARASRTCPDACRDRLPAGAGKTFPAFPAHAHPQFYVSGKRPMFGTYSPSGYFSMLIHFKLWLKQNGRLFADNILQSIFANGNFFIALLMPWCRINAKQSPDPMRVDLTDDHMGYQVSMSWDTFNGSLAMRMIYITWIKLSLSDGFE